MSFAQNQKLFSKALIRNAFRIAANVAAVALILSVSIGAHAATATAPSVLSGGVGSVDIQKVLNNYNKKATSESDFQAVVDHYDSVFKVQQGSAMLAQADQHTLGTLLLETTPTPAEQAQIKALESKSQSDFDELTALQQKQNQTDADKARLGVLTKEQSDGQQALQASADEYKKDLDAKNQAASDALATDVRAAVASIAQQKGLAVVFDSSFAIYASNDITQLVIARLNGGK